MQTFCQYLKDLQCYDKKYIPEEYKYGSIKQRIDFLKGYFDSDGSVNKDGESFFVQKREDLINDVMEVMTSLGISYGFHSRKDFDKRTQKNIHIIQFILEFLKKILCLNFLEKMKD